MNAQLACALFLTVSATVFVSHVGKDLNWSVVTHKYSWLLTILGFPSMFLAIYVLVQSKGWTEGLITFVVVAVVARILLGFVFEGLRTMIGIGAGVIGIIGFFFT